jgi:hypothetical protein
MRSDERLKKFSSIYANIDNFGQGRTEAVLKGTLLWEFGERIATIIGGRNPSSVSAYVRNMVITALLVIDPVKELKQLKELVHASNIP